MNTNRKALIFASSLTLLGITGAYVALRNQHTQEPAFEGRPLISWLPDLDISAGPASRSNAMHAIQQMGCTNDQQKLTAIGAFQKLGPVARDAMPYLKRLYDRDKAVWYASGAITNAMYRIDAPVAQRMLAEP